jgi:Ca2+-binding RTX toxin-like protein
VYNGMANYVGNPGDDFFTGTSSDDTFDLRQGGNDTALGKDGNDTFILDGALNTADRIDGGAGFDTVVLFGDYYLQTDLAPGTLSNIESVLLTGGGYYNLHLSEGT